ncbi:hypothetical protein [Mycolicibacterium sphagni]|uniref:hypothetical protein n=1 Tax=Mycolicibacterium sphagni TaxID=1786 RepID=UPI0021F283ED|nr:hypothetical protein [Mycolicibacterium sphagni]MCV7175100.1 hypothetical protein [Mycolicibacterium sphagni]
MIIYLILAVNELRARRRARGGRHRGPRGCYPNHWRSVEAFQEAERVSAEFVALVKRDINRGVQDARDRQIANLLGHGPDAFMYQPTSCPPQVEP